FTRESARHHGDGHIADDFGGRGDLDDVAEHLVDLRVRLRHLRPAVIVESQRARLLAKIRVLAPRHAVNVDLGGARANRADRTATLRRWTPGWVGRSGRTWHRLRRPPRRRRPRLR